MSKDINRLCKNLLSCQTCRDKEGGRQWRESLRKAFRLPNDETDFECPHGLPWGCGPQTEAQKEAKEKKGFRAIVLDGEETILGLGTVIPSSRRHEHHTGILDFLVHPNYANRTSEMLDRLDQDCGLDHLTVYVEVNEENKRRTLERAGYKKHATLERQLCIGSDYFDLVSYRKHFNR